MRSRLGRLNPPALLALGYATLVLLGTIMLRLPAATHGHFGWVDSLFTATSAATVTGLGVAGTGETFTFFGELVLVVLMQLGGLGLMTFAVLTALMLGRRVGLRQRLVLGDAMGDTPIGNVIQLTKVLVIFSIAMEVLGALLLAIRFVPEHGLVDGAWWSIFHSVSAFNNAGFALPTDNLIGHRGEVLVPLVTSMLFIVGGIGFTVVADLRRTRTFRLLSLHTKLMLVGTLVINAVAFSMFMLLEYRNPGTLGPLGPIDKVITSWFQAVTPRTAGFNTIDFADVEDSTILMTMLLMFIGGGSASTASGIKLSTFIVIVLAVVAFLRGRTEPRAFDRRIATETVYKAMSVTAISALLLGFGMFVLVAIEPEPLVELVFEAVSAFGTVGLSLGVTPDLHALGQLVICMLMFAGRIGPLSLVFVLARRQSSRISYPKGDVLTG